MSVVVNPWANLDFYELDGSSTYSITMANTWEDWDLSAVVPIGTRYVEISGKALNNGGNVGARMNGSAQDRYIEGYDGGSLLDHVLMTVRLDANRILEVKTDSNTKPFRLFGYWI